MKKNFSLILLLLCSIAFTSCLKEAIGFADMTPEIAKKWVTAASGTYRGTLNVIDPKTGSGEIFTTEATVTANDSVVTIANFPVKALAKYAWGDFAEMLANCDESVNGTFKAVLHPYNGAMPNMYTFYMFPAGESMDVKTTWNGVQYNISIKWGTDLTLPESVAIRYGEAYIFPLADYDILLSTINGHIIVESLKINGEAYNIPVLFDLSIRRTAN